MLICGLLRVCGVRRPLLPQGRQNAQEHRPAHIEVLKPLIAAAQLVVKEFNGETPNTMKDLIKLPGVARKTANVVLWGGFGINEGLAVDTHVKRISGRLGLTKHTDPVDIEKDLVKLFPQSEWGKVNHRMVWFGRHVCDARKPLCDECEMAPFCPKVGVE